MDQRVTALGAMFEQTAAVIEEIGEDQSHLPTPCPDLDVLGLLDHLAVWVQVFDSAVNDRSVGFDPLAHHVTTDWGEIFVAAAASILDGLRSGGTDRMMTMVTDQLPGEFILNMLLMEYIGHGWDLCRALGRPAPYSDELAAVALTAAQTIIEPQYRGAGLFGEEVAVAEAAPPMDHFVAFIGRDPQWAASQHASIASGR